MHLVMRWRGGGTRRGGSWVHERVEEDRREVGEAKQGGSRGGLKEKNYSRDKLSCRGLTLFLIASRPKLETTTTLVVGVFFLPRGEVEGGRGLKKRNKRKDSEGTERGLSPEEMIKKHVWRRHKPRNVYVTCLSLSLSFFLSLFLSLSFGWNVKYVGQGRAREHRFLSLSLSLFLLRSLSHLFVRLFAFPISPSPPFLHIPPISQFPPPSFFFIFFFFCSSLKSDFNSSCRGYYTSSVILLREIFIRGKGIRRRPSRFENSRSNLRVDSSSFNCFR